MCTAVSFYNNNFYFGRNFDYPVSYKEEILITPRNYPLKYRFLPTDTSHFEFIGAGILQNGYPLYYDGVNNCGLCVAGLAFSKSAKYFPPVLNKTNIAPFEFIPYILSRCGDLCSARKLLENINIADVHFNENFKNTPMHWIISSKDGSIVVEPLKDGVKIYDNPVGVLANEPPFDYHILNLNRYLCLTPKTPENSFSKNINLTPFSHGMGALGLPGDFSSPSRFVKASFTLSNSKSNSLSEAENVNRLFNVLYSVAQIKGCTVTDKGADEYTIYSSCCNADTGIYYYTTYNNKSIKKVSLSDTKKDGDKVISVTMDYSSDI